MQLKEDEKGSSNFASQIKDHRKNLKIEFPEQIEQQLAIFALGILRKAAQEYATYGDDFKTEYRGPIEEKIKEMERVCDIAENNCLVNLIINNDNGSSDYSLDYDKDSMSDDSSS
ncbi:hypothetical protein TRFO_29802 [Tritrichomonas foetus]|uniref:Uncharacterized protein n=1 Tax=Tritrichomonas foetus TaxID=1144522 RepID=A0A1J4JZL4_9EUKA|nr:hypothetical protein TRFO_29802 [Tritrichomonas foetus]|eukprot:OHT02972.1 hypothetical protein TRFO_29802 [Tritrichomonas foetus]